MRGLNLACVWFLMSATGSAQVPTPEPSFPPKDTRPRSLVAHASPEILWPADERYVEITVRIVLSDETDPRPRVRLVSITCRR